MIEFNEGKHEYRNESGMIIPSVTQIMKAAGFVFFQGPDSERSMDLGRKVHKTCELYDLNNLDEDLLDPILRAYLASWEKFLEDFKFKIKAVEGRVYSKKYGFAGTFDRIGVLGGVNTIIDIKTNNPGPFTAIQTAGYALAYNENVKSDKKKVVQRASVILESSGKYKYRAYSSPQDEKVFLGCLNIYNWRKQNGK